MSTGMIYLQPAITLATNVQQELRFAGRIPGGAKSGYAAIDVLGLANWSGPPTIRIYSASDLSLDPDMAVGSGFWSSAGVTGNLTSTGAKPVALTQMAEYVRWAVEGGSPGGGAKLSFMIHIYTFDA